MCKTTMLECRYCDGMTSYYNSSYEMSLCLTCGAEWDPIEVEVEVEAEIGFELEESEEACEECRGVYLVSYSDAQSKYFYCSSECEDRYHSRYCKTCSDQYDQRESQASASFLYCCEACEIEAKEALERE